jgi:hypothetical protein
MHVVSNFEKIVSSIKLMKKITYRGGLISFQIPKDWIEEYEENGGGTFYEDSQESGTLRINVLTVNE